MREPPIWFRQASAMMLREELPVQMKSMLCVVTGFLRLKKIQHLPGSQARLSVSPQGTPWQQCAVKKSIRLCMALRSAR